MQNIFNTIEKYRMITPGMGVIAGISGGADSVCLLYVLNEYRNQVPFDLRVVHVEHGIRGSESMEDAAFTEKLCKSMGVPCHTVRIDVIQTAKAQGLSTEEAGRAERYRIFEEIRSKYGGDRIAVAHNQNDQAETVLWNLARGSGLKGLGGIRPVRERIIRPLLFTGREEIEEILRKAGLQWRTDRTNLEQEYTRNRIRLSLLPQMQKELNRQSVRHIAEAADKLQRAQDYMERQTDAAAARCLYREEGRSGDSVVIQLAEYLQEDEWIRTELLKRGLLLLNGGNNLKDIGSVHLESLTALTGMDCGSSIDLPGRIRAVRERDILRLQRKQEKRKTGGEAVSEVLEITQTGCFKMGRWCIKTEILSNTAEIRNEIKTEKKYTKWLSYDTINRNMQFRTRRSGDYLIINEQGGKKKLKDYFIDQKIPREERDQMCILADGAHVLWVPGYRISEAAKVRRETKQVIRIQLEEEKDERKSKDFFAGNGG